MKKLAAALLLSAAAYAHAQLVPIWIQWPNGWVRSDGGAPVASGGIATDPIFTAAGQLVYGTGVGTASALAAGTSSQWLHGGTTPGWGAFGTGLAISGSTVNAVKPVKTFTLENPGAAENMTMFYFPNAVTITEVRFVVKGSATPSVTPNVAFGTDRSAAGTNVTTSPSAVTNVTTGVAATLNNTAVSAASYMWLTTSAQSGTVTDINCTVSYTEP